MIRPARISVAVCLSVALAVTPCLEASHGHGGGGGHSGGGHMGGGHVGGGHMGGGHIGGGHVGGFSGGHINSGHVGTQHFGGAQHFGGSQHFGGTQHLGTQHFGTQHLGTQHLGGVQQHIQHNGIQSFHQNSVGSQQHILHNGVQQHLGNNSVHRLNSTLGNTQHHGSQFLQQHGSNGINAVHHNNVTSLGNNQVHHGSQFLNHHGTHTTAALHHTGLQNQGLTNHHLTNAAAAGNSNFLAHHHQAGNSSLGNHHLGVANNQVVHHGVNHVGSFANHNLGQNFGYRHHGVNGVGVNGVGALGYRHNHNHHWGGGGGYGYRYGGYGYRYGGIGYGYGLGLGYGFYPAYYSFGFGLGRFGYGWGLGYGLYGGYSRLGCFAYQPCCYYQPYAYNYGYGYPSYAYGYGGYGYSPYGTYASLTPGLMGYSASYAPVGSPTAIITTPSNGVALDPLADPNQPDPNQLASSDPKSAAASALPTAEQYAQIGETAFKARDYKSAVRAWRHGLIDDPNNGVLVLMLAQALFATEQYNEAAGATQFGMQLLDKSKWETVVKNYRELYGKVDDYTTQLRGLEKAAREKTDDPALRFLLGYHYGFLGFAKEATQQLDKCVNLAPEDETAQKLLELFNDKLPKDPAKKEEPPAPSKPPGPASAENVPPLNPAVVPPPKIPEPPLPKD